MSERDVTAGHVFLSYVREDSQAADWLQGLLEAAGVPVWRDTVDLWPGEDWRLQIRRAITAEALVFIACFSSNSMNRRSSYQNEELNLAVEQMRRRLPDDPWLIPVRFDDCVIPDLDIGGGRTLTSIQHADLFGHKECEGAKRLITAVLRILGRRRGADAPARFPSLATPAEASLAHAKGTQGSKPRSLGMTCFNPRTPSVARVYDYWLGGKDNFAADRRMAAQFAAVYPGVRKLCRDNRAFVCRVAAWAAGQGIRQILDLGSGLPTVLNTHDAARAVDPGTRVAYVDNDLVVIRHAQALLTTGGGLTAVQADLTDPAAVWHDPQVREVIDPAEPVCILLASVLHFLDACAARTVVAGYAELAVPGSLLAISLSRNDDQEQHARAQDAYTAAHLYSHSQADIESFFAGLELIPPGVALAQAWRAGMARRPAAPKGSAYILAGAGRVRG